MAEATLTDIYYAITGSRNVDPGAKLVPVLGIEYWEADVQWIRYPEANPLKGSRFGNLSNLVLVPLYSHQRDKTKWLKVSGYDMFEKWCYMGYMNEVQPFSIKEMWTGVQLPVAYSTPSNIYPLCAEVKRDFDAVNIYGEHVAVEQLSPNGSAQYFIAVLDPSLVNSTDSMVHSDYLGDADTNWHPDSPNIRPADDEGDSYIRQDSVINLLAIQVQDSEGNSVPYYKVVEY
jgi:hypothetical protein